VPEDYVEERRGRRKKGGMRFDLSSFLLSLFSSDEKIGTTYPPAQGSDCRTSLSPSGERGLFTSPSP
jgi:hypothetical protein